MIRRAKGKKAARAKGKIKAKLRRAKSAAKRRPKKTAIRIKRRSVARKQARSKSKARVKAKRPPARAKKIAATTEGGTRPPTVGPDLDEYRRSSRDIWERMAPGWEERRDWVWEASRAVGEWLVDRLAPQPGQTLLELAAGAGDTGFAAIARVAGEGRLMSTDFSPRMV